MRKRLIWFRDDLRITDNSAFTAALEGISPDHLEAVFLTADHDWRDFGYGQNRLFYTEKLLRSLASSLALCGIAFQVVKLNTYSEQAAWVIKYCRDHSIDSLYINHEYQLNEIKRDRLIMQKLESDVTVKGFTDRIIIRPGTVRTGEDKYYTVFSPFKRRWLEALKQTDYRIYGRPAQVTASESLADWEPLAIEPLSNISWAATNETQAQTHLQQFIEGKLSRYGQDRNGPALSGTSQISPYLARGLLSPRQCLHGVESALNCSIWEVADVEFTWINELIWREFYQHLLIGFPKLSMNQAFRSETENVAWLNSKESIERWKNGTTGIPIVDAGMRELKATGWMHNRVRMIVAQFLTKNLLCDWRIGELHFMDWLIDSDLGANNGGWQWSASTGTDAAPYFRIFNPVSQGESHDGDGTYVTRWIPELASLPIKNRHAPWTTEKPLNYPPPIVNLKESRQRAIDTFKELK